MSFTRAISTRSSPIPREGSSQRARVRHASSRARTPALSFLSRRLFSHGLADPRRLPRLCVRSFFFFAAAVEFPNVIEINDSIKKLQLFSVIEVSRSAPLPPAYPSETPAARGARPSSLVPEPQPLTRSLPFFGTLPLVGQEASQGLLHQRPRQVPAEERRRHARPRGHPDEYVSTSLLFEGKQLVLRQGHPNPAHPSPHPSPLNPPEATPTPGMRCRAALFLLTLGSVSSSFLPSRCALARSPIVCVLLDRLACPRL